MQQLPKFDDNLSKERNDAEATGEVNDRFPNFFLIFVCLGSYCLTIFYVKMLKVLR